MDNVAFPAAVGLRCLPEFLEIAGGRQIRGIREKTGGSRLVGSCSRDGWMAYKLKRQPSAQGPWIRALPTRSGQLCF